MGGLEQQLRFIPPPSPSREDPSMQQCPPGSGSK